ncbi:MAG TPA: ankyrin repeat domain-containing protein [Draconibacterium sp.]|nr:ankyrin repeat domain-containing protein [Draconibacterium sp.]
MKTDNLLDACERNDIELAKTLIANGADVNMPGYEKNTPLQIALENKHFQIAELLILNGADVNIVGFSGKTPLHIVAERGYLEIAKLLVTHSVDINVKDSYKRTPLYNALENNHFQIAELLILNGADVNSSVYSKTPLILAIRKGQLQIFELLLSKNASLDIEYNSTLLHIAAEAGNLKIIQILISKGIDVNTKNENNETPLLIAVKSGHFHISELLISKGSDINILDNSGKNLLHLAAENGPLENVQLFISKGFEIDTKTKCIEEAEDIPTTFFLKCLSYIEKLLFGIPEKKLSIYNITPLHLAVEGGQLDIVKFLISKGANVNQKDDEGNTPLHYNKITRYWNLKLSDDWFTTEKLTEHIEDPIVKEEVIKLIEESTYYRERMLRDIRGAIELKLIKQTREQILNILLENGARIDVANNHLIYPDYFEIEKGDFREIGQIMRKAGPEKLIKCDYSSGSKKFNKTVNKYFQLYNDCLEYNISSKETDRTSKYTSGKYTYNFKSALKAINKLKSLRNPISNIMLHLLSEVEDIRVTLSWICDNPGDKGELSLKPIRERAKNILKKQGNPPIEPDAFLDMKAYKSRRNIFARMIYPLL